MAIVKIIKGVISAELSDANFEGKNAGKLFCGGNLLSKSVQTSIAPGIKYLGNFLNIAQSKRNFF